MPQNKFSIDFDQIPVNITLGPSGLVYSLHVLSSVCFWLVADLCTTGRGDGSFRIDSPFLVYRTSSHFLSFLSV